MITGFNTDVRHGNVVFHVQTEDKGEGNPCVESLIYVGGQILARKRAGYQSLLEAEGALAEVAKLMEQQHRSMISEIRAGKLDAKVAELKAGGASATPAETKVAPPRTSTRVEPPAGLAPPPAPAPAPPVAARPGQGVETPPAPAADDRSLDQVILDYLEMESEQEKLILSMDRRSDELGAGREVTVSFRTRSSLGAEPIGNAKVVVRLISTIGELKLLGEGKTDDRGQLELTLDVPQLKAGTGALIVTAESSIGQAEIRHLI